MIASLSNIQSSLRIATESILIRFHEEEAVCLHADTVGNSHYEGSQTHAIVTWFIFSQSGEHFSFICLPGLKFLPTARPKTHNETNVSYH